VFSFSVKVLTSIGAGALQLGDLDVPFANAGYSLPRYNL
jgi:hypothetical protein